MHTTIRRSHHLLGAILLIAGTTIGVAMIALPVVTGLAGFIPSLFIMLAVWLYLFFAALYFVEVNVALKEKVNVISMAEATIGPLGTVICWSAYLFLLYALNTAYMFVTIELFQEALRFFGQEVSKFFCALPLLLIFALLFRSGMHLVDIINRVCMVGFGISFILLVGLSLPHTQGVYLTTVNMHHMLPAIAVICTAFGYHIIIPSLVTYLHGNVGELKKALAIGSFVPFIVYALWQLAVLGNVPAHGDVSIESALASSTNGAAILAERFGRASIATISKGVVFFAVITSFLGVSISLFDFLADALHKRKHAAGKWKLFFFCFVPPLYFALSDPHIFFTALDYAGTIGVIVLLALMPAVMAWRKRYVLRLASPYTAPGGKIGLGIFIAISIALLGLELLLKV